MDYYAGIDVSLELSSVCIVDEKGKIQREVKVGSAPDDLVAFFRGENISLARIGLEAGPLSQWLYAGLKAAGFEVELLETRHVKAGLAAMMVKTDRKDARGIAQLLRMGWFRSVHCKSLPSQDVRALLAARKLLLGKGIDVELSIRGILRGFGLKVGKVSPGRFPARVRELVEGQPTLPQIAEALLRAREVLRKEMNALHRQILAIVRGDAVCRRMMTVPGVGALTALTYTSALDDPTRFTSSKTVGAHFGMTPKKYQSGEIDITGPITKVGDALVRCALYEAAQVMLTRSSKPSALKTWALGVAKRRGQKRAKVALARKLAVVLHRMWVDGTAFNFGKEVSAAT